MFTNREKTNDETKQKLSKRGSVFQKSFGSKKECLKMQQY